MLGKLMKYEVRSCGRIFFPFYIVVLIFSIVASLFINFDNSKIALTASAVIMNMIFLYYI